LKMYN